MNNMPLTPVDESDVVPPSPAHLGGDPGDSNEYSSFRTLPEEEDNTSQQQEDEEEQGAPSNHYSSGFGQEVRVL